MNIRYIIYSSNIIHALEKTEMETLNRIRLVILQKFEISLIELSNLTSSGANVVVEIVSKVCGLIPRIEFCGYRAKAIMYEIWYRNTK